MRIWIKSLLVGSLFTIIASLIVANFFQQDKKQLFTVHYVLDIMPDKPSSAGSIHGTQINAVLNVSAIIAQRCKAAGYLPEADTSQPDIGAAFIIRHVDDTLRLGQWITKMGRLEIREIYMLSEIPGFLNIGRTAPVLNDSLGEKSSEEAGKSLKLSELSGPNQKNQPVLDTLITFSNIISNGDNPSIGSVEEEDTAVLRAILQMPESLLMLPADIKFCYGPVDSRSEGKVAKMFFLYAIRLNNEIPSIENSDIRSAIMDYSPDGTPEVAFSLDEAGSGKWEYLTTKNVGKYLAIILDDVAVSVPKVNEPISGGHAVINGGFTVDEALILAGQLNSGTVPVKVNILQQEVFPESRPGSLRWGIMIASAFLLGTGLSFLIFYALKNK